jgi:hypothetical protein
MALIIIYWIIVQLGKYIYIYVKCWFNKYLNNSNLNGNVSQSVLTNLD